MILGSSFSYPINNMPANPAVSTLQYIQHPVFSPYTHLSSSGPSTILAFLDYYSSFPNCPPWTLTSLRACALCSSCRDLINTEVRSRHLSGNIPLRASCTPFKTTNFITIYKALFCLQSFLTPVSLIPHFSYQSLYLQSSSEL